MENLDIVISFNWFNIMCAVLLVLFLILAIFNEGEASGVEDKDSVAYSSYVYRRMLYAFGVLLLSVTLAASILKGWE